MAAPDDPLVKLSSQLPKLVDLAKKAVIAQLYGAADDAESSVLDGLVVRAGFAWRCVWRLDPNKSTTECGYQNVITDDECESCGAPRPEGV